MKQSKKNNLQFFNLLLFHHGIDDNARIGFLISGPLRVWCAFWFFFTDAPANNDIINSGVDNHSVVVLLGTTWFVSHSPCWTRALALCVLDIYPFGDLVRSLPSATPKHSRCRCQVVAIPIMAVLALCCLLGATTISSPTAGRMTPLVRWASVS